ncbi:MAG: OmpP1/FadL family transporter [Candidatus Aminicenantales bacterium]
MKRVSPGNCLAGLFLIFAAGLPLYGQFVPGQYTEDAPFRTWNAYPYLGAAALARGQAAFAWGTDATVSAANPALLTTLPKTWSLSLGGSCQYATAMKYGPINTGVLSTDGAMGQKIFTGDHFAVSFRSGRIALAASTFLSESFTRPTTEASRPDEYSIQFKQSGYLRVFNLAAAFRLSSRLGIGLGLNADSGRWKSNYMESVLSLGYALTSAKSANLRDFYFNGGLFWDLSAAVRAALTFRTPSTLEARTETVDRYQVSFAGTDISIQGNADDSFDRPLVVGAGVTIQNGPRLRSAVDLSWFRWSSCRAVWLGETEVRDFRDTLRVCVGGEYFVDLWFFKKIRAAPVRFGVVYDPQPQGSPRSAYFAFTFGLGLEIGGLRLDLGALVGYETGSGDNLVARKISLGAAYVF